MCSYLTLHYGNKRYLHWKNPALRFSLDFHRPDEISTAILSTARFRLIA